MGLLDGIWQGIKAVGFVKTIGGLAALTAMGSVLIYTTAKALGMGNPTLQVGGAGGLTLNISFVMWIVIGIIALIIILRLIKRK